MFPLSYIEASKGKYLTIGLKDGSLVSGWLIGTDKFSNLTINKATAEIRGTEDLEEKEFETTMIRGSMVKYIIFQKDIMDYVKRVRDQEKIHTYQNRNPQNRDYQNRDYQNRDGNRSGRGGYNGRGGRGGFRGGQRGGRY